MLWSSVLHLFAYWIVIGLEWCSDCTNSSKQLTENKTCCSCKHLCFHQEKNLIALWIVCGLYASVQVLRDFRGSSSASGWDNKIKLRQDLSEFIGESCSCTRCSNGQFWLAPSVGLYGKVSFSWLASLNLEQQHAVLDDSPNYSWQACVQPARGMLRNAADWKKHL